MKRGNNKYNSHKGKSCPVASRPCHGHGSCSLLSWLLCILALSLLSTYAPVSVLQSSLHVTSRPLGLAGMVPVSVSASQSASVSESESVETYPSEYRHQDAVHDISAASKEEPLHGAISSAALSEDNDVNLKDDTDTKYTDTPMIPMIPHNIIFTYKSNILEQKRPVQFYENVRHTIDTYQQAWPQDTHTKDNGNSGDDSNQNDDAPMSVWFLDNRECRSVIQKVEPGLVRHFDRETHGAFKSDICRAAALYVTGGYYFDIDMKVIQALLLPHSTTFATSYGHRRDNFFQSFTAARQHSPILKEALKLMLLYYNDQLKVQAQLHDTNRTLSETLKINGPKLELKDSFGSPASLLEIYESLASPSSSGVDGDVDLLKHLVPFFNGDQKLHGNLIGPSTLKDAYDRVMKENGITSSTATNSSMAVHEESLILTESNLEDQEGAKSGLYPNLLRQNGTGCCCNFVVHDRSTQQPFFFSRIVGASVRCHNASAAAAGRRIKSSTSGRDKR